MFQTLIDCETLSRHLDEAGWVVMDCRFDLSQPEAGRAAYTAGHIPGARYADLNRDLSAPLSPGSGRHPLPDPELFARRLGEWGISSHSQVVVYDASDAMYAVRLWWMLRWLGHRAVAVLDGGFAAWQGAGLPVATQVPQPETGSFKPHVHTTDVISTEQVRENLQTAKLMVVDARATPRYAGEVEPIDPIAGHIPGAVNYPFSENLDANGRFLPAATLRERFATLPSPAQRVVHMCGSGVSACHNLLAMEIAGLQGSRLYAGSWSEWVQNQENPVARSREA